MLERACPILSPGKVSVEANEVIYLLKLKGKSQRGIADELGLSHAAVNNTIHRRNKNHVIAQAIAAAVGLPLTRVFPDTYQIDR